MMYLNQINSNSTHQSKTTWWCDFMVTYVLYLKGQINNKGRTYPYLVTDCNSINQWMGRILTIIVQSSWLLTGFQMTTKTLPDDKCLSPTDDRCVDTEPRVLHGHCCSDNNQGMTWLCQGQGQIEWHSQRISSWSQQHQVTNSITIFTCSFSS